MQSIMLKVLVVVHVVSLLVALVELFVEVPWHIVCVNLVIVLAYCALLYFQKVFDILRIDTVTVFPISHVRPSSCISGSYFIFQPAWEVI